MDLAVAAADGAAAVEVHQGVPGALGIAGFREAAEDEIHGALLGEGAAAIEDRSARVEGLGDRETCRRRAEHGEGLGQHDDLGAGVGRVAYQPFRDREIAGHVRRGAELDETDAAHDGAACPSRAACSAARISAWRSRVRR